MSKPTYSNTSLHEALNKKYPKKGLCESCGFPSDGYALIHGKEYSLNREDYLELCFNCHGSYDNHTEYNKIECICIDKRTRYKHGDAYKDIEREDAVLKTCAFSRCDNEFWTTLSKKIYCTKRCGVSAFRERKGLEVPLYEGRICQREGCKNTIDSSQKSTVKYCSNACRQKIYNDKHKEKAKEKRDQIRATQTEAKQKKQEKKAVDDFIKELMGE